jgi:uncharacterized protein YndB with AHSA1/START domain
MTNELVHSAFTVERRYPFPAAQVFACFADTDKLRRWLVEGEGWTIYDFTHDFRVGGFDHSLFSWQQGPKISNDGVYHEIVENRRIISSYSMGMDGGIFSVSLLTTEFREENGETVLTLTEQGTYMGDKDAVAGREEGFRELLGKLGDELVSQK